MSASSSTTFAPTQDNHLAQLKTGLGKDVLLIVRFDGSEGLSELSNYIVEAVSLTSDLDFDAIIGTQCSVTIETFNRETRTFCGILVEAKWLGGGRPFFRYRLTLRPWPWLLTRTTDCRIFQNEKAPDIIKKIFEDRGFSQGTHFDSRLIDEASYPVLEYCVQYQESDFNFVSRLMEKEGIYYYFGIENEREILVLADGFGSHEELKTLQDTGGGLHGGAKTKANFLRFFPASERMLHSSQYIEYLVSDRQLRSGVFEFNDYNYESSGANMLSTKQGSEKYAKSQMEVFDYPGDYKTADAGNHYVQVALEAEQARDHRRQTGGEAISLFPGCLTNIQGHPSDKQNRQYLVVRAQHAFGDQSYKTTAAAGTQSDVTYAGQYEFQPSDRPFRAPIVTPKPRIYGVQTAVVVDKKARGRMDKSPEEIEVEKLSEIYVQFYWDRRRHEEKRSCKLRCAQLWAGKKWGGQFIPRIGMEVVVEFLEGDPDRPLVVGCVYNDANQPPWDLPSQKTISGVKSESSKGGQGYNSWNFEDKKGGEQINVHAQRDLNVTVLANETRSIGNDLKSTITHSETHTVGEKFKTPTGSPSRKTTIKNGDDQLELETGAILHTAKTKIVLTVGPSKLTIDPTGITLDAPTITIKAGALCTIKGLPVKIN